MLTQKLQEKPHNIDQAEWLRLQTISLFECEARLAGFSRIAGIDEAGRGPLAGPVVAGACLIPEGVFIPGVDDSKKLTPVRRAELYKLITGDQRIIWGVGIVSSQEIDRINILQATIMAMKQALLNLSVEPDILLVDGLDLKHKKIPSKKIIKGDEKSHSIAAASILAKETRDRLMEEYHLEWPQFGFDRHKGYGTPQHIDAIFTYGPCPIHRMTFEPIKGQRTKDRRSL